MKKISSVQKVVPALQSAGQDVNTMFSIADFSDKMLDALGVEENTREAIKRAILVVGSAVILYVLLNALTKKSY